MSESNDFTRLIFPCPTCKGKCQFSIDWSSNKSAVLHQIHGHLTRYVLKCSACGEFIFFQTKKVDTPWPNESTIERQFPPSGINPHQSIPDIVAVDIKEASICLSIGAWNAAAAMCRRALQSCAKDKGANPKDQLFDQLDELKNQRIIPDLIYDMATAIRKKGNVGAHPGKDPILNEAVSETEAKAVFSITEEVFKYIYILPSEVNAIVKATNP